MIYLNIQSDRIICIIMLIIQFIIINDNIVFGQKNITIYSILNTQCVLNFTEYNINVIFLN